MEEIKPEKKSCWFFPVELTYLVDQILRFCDYT